MASFIKVCQIELSHGNQSVEEQEEAEAAEAAEEEEETETKTICLPRYTGIHNYTYN